MVWEIGTKSKTVDGLMKDANANLVITGRTYKMTEKETLGIREITDILSVIDIPFIVATTAPTHDYYKEIVVPLAKANKVTAESSSGSSVMLAGKAQNVDFDASSGASISGDKLTAANGKAEASSGASVSVSANVNLEAEASSGGRVRYSGNPTMVNVSSSSGGSISRL